MRGAMGRRWRREISHVKRPRIAPLTGANRGPVRNTPPHLAEMASTRDGHKSFTRSPLWRAEVDGHLLTASLARGCVLDD